MITPHSRLKTLEVNYVERLEAAGREQSTLLTYKDALRLHVLPAMGELCLSEISVGSVDRFLIDVNKTFGYGAARHSRTVLSGLLDIAVRNDAIRSNPVRDASPISGKAQPARALTLEEVHQLRASLRNDTRAVRQDLPSLVDFMLGTGLRISEAIGVVWSDLDLEAGTLVLTGVVARDGQGKLYRKPKTKSVRGWRKLHLPAWLVEILKTRPRVPNEWDVVFPSPQGMLRDKSNTNRAIRAAMNPLGFDWVTSHTFRKTAATLMSQNGVSTREIADHLGHAKISMTMDTYFGRNQGPEGARQALQPLGDSLDFNADKSPKVSNAADSDPCDQA